MIREQWDPAEKVKLEIWQYSLKWREFSEKLIAGLVVAKEYSVYITCTTDSQVSISSVLFAK